MVTGSLPPQRRDEQQKTRRARHDQTASDDDAGMDPAEQPGQPAGVASASPTALAAKSTEYRIGDRPFIDCRMNAEVATHAKVTPIEKAMTIR